MRYGELPGAATSLTLRGPPRRRILRSHVSIIVHPPAPRQRGFLRGMEIEPQRWTLAPEDNCPLGGRQPIPVARRLAASKKVIGQQTMWTQLKYPPSGRTRVATKGIPKQFTQRLL